MWNLFKRYLYIYLLLVLIQILFWSVAVVVATNLWGMFVTLCLILFGIIYLFQVFHYLLTYLKVELLQYLIDNPNYLQTGGIISHWIRLRLVVYQSLPILLSFYSGQLKSNLSSFLPRSVALTVGVFLSSLLLMYYI